jgi:hypothetical protein
MFRLVIKKAWNGIGICLSMLLWWAFATLVVVFYREFAPVHTELVWKLTIYHQYSDELASSLVFMVVVCFTCFIALTAGVLQVVISDIFKL